MHVSTAHPFLEFASLSWPFCSSPHPSFLPPFSQWVIKHHAARTVLSDFFSSPIAFFSLSVSQPSRGLEDFLWCWQLRKVWFGLLYRFSFDNRKLESDWFLLLTSSCSGEHVESFERSRTSTVPGSAARQFARLLWYAFGDGWVDHLSRLRSKLITNSIL